MKNAFINSSLPVIIKVMKKTGFRRYDLKFATQIVSTKSQFDLEIDSEYFANIKACNSRVININHLVKRDRLNRYLENGLELLDIVLEENGLAKVVDFIKYKMANPKNQSEFMLYLDIILALNDGIFHLPFFYEDRTALLQIKFENPMSIYLLFSCFAPLMAKIHKGKFICIATEYEKFSVALAKELKCKYEVKSIEPFLMKKEKLLDFKG